MNGPAAPLAPVAQTPPQLYRQLLAAGWDVTALPRIRDACLLAATETRHLLRGSGKPFSCHLVGVGSLVAEATGDVDLTVAALLHALTQARVSASDPGDALLARFGSRVDGLLRAYAGEGELQPDARMVEAGHRDARDIRILQLADQLEDGLDGGPWWHGAAEDTGSEGGGSSDRLTRLRALVRQFSQAPLLGAPTLLRRYEVTMVEWTQGVWPACLRSGWYSSCAPTGRSAA